MKFERRYVALAIAVIGIIALSSPDRNGIVGICCFAIAAYVMFADEGIQKIIDWRKRYEKAATSPGGRNALLSWSDIIDTLHRERWEELYLYSYIDQREEVGDGRTHALVIDAEGNIWDQYNPNVNDLAFGDWRRITKNKALGLDRAKNEQSSVDYLRTKGWVCVPPTVKNSAFRIENNSG